MVGVLSVSSWIGPCGSAVEDLLDAVEHGRRCVGRPLEDVVDLRTIVVHGERPSHVFWIVDEIDDEDKPAINNKLKTNKPQASQSLNDNVTSNEPANTIAQITHSHSPNWTPAREISDASDAMAPGASPSKLIANDHAIVVNAKPN